MPADLASWLDLASILAQAEADTDQRLIMLECQSGCQAGPHAQAELVGTRCHYDVEGMPSRLRRHIPIKDASRVKTTIKRFDGQS